MIKTILGDITKIDLAEAIVNAANSSLLGGGGVDGAIHRAAGPELLEECRKLHGCKTGQAKITKAYQLPCKYVIHTVGPVWNGGVLNEEERLADCYRNSLLIAVQNNIRTIAFPSISTGIYRFPVEQAAKIAVRTVKEFLDKHPGKIDEVIWVLFDENTEKIYRQAVEDSSKYKLSRKLKFGLAQEQDRIEIMNLYGSMIGVKGCTWSREYPNMELLIRDIKNENEFCMRNEADDIIAAIVIDEDEEVRKLPFWNPDYKKTGELARLAVRQDYQNQGIAVKMIQETAGIMWERGYDAIHFLVSRNNPAALASYQKLNLHLAGETNLFGGNWLCYEGLIRDKILNERE
ncbi:MAG: O-acetyl-ADP-ribose deacetylase [Lachnospiraceae bacterium]|nr:O-acetyl-ADP-ribose deacetylase [Lachnospiraceae bacterium]